MKITEEKLKKIRDSDMDLEHYMVLWSKYNKLGWLTSYRVREVVYNHLENLGYLTSTRNISSSGKKVVESIDATVKEDKDEYAEEFEEFWTGWPTTDKCHHFPASGRYMRGNKHDAYIAYRDLRNNSVEHSNLILARDNHVKTLIDESARVNQNKLKFLPNPARWLSQKIWEAWLHREVQQSKRQINVT